MKRLIIAIVFFIVSIFGLLITVGLEGSNLHINSDLISTSYFILITLLIFSFSYLVYVFIKSDK